jgi:hypothetical protein
MSDDDSLFGDAKDSTISRRDSVAVPLNTPPSPTRWDVSFRLYFALSSSVVNDSQGRLLGNYYLASLIGEGGLGILVHSIALVSAAMEHFLKWMD